MTNIFEYLSHNSYPGRGILVGHYDEQPVIAYFIMGRSVNSRNRIFVKEDNVLSTKAFDESKVADPSLIIYNAIREHDEDIIVTNGNQTDTIYDYLSNGQSFEEALETREYEPDAPNFTPRISAIIHEDSYQISILKKADDHCLRKYFNYQTADKLGHFISTYDHDGNPLPSFSGEPLEIRIEKPFEEFAAELWSALDSENKISLYVRFGDRDLIFNKNEGD